MVALGEKLCRNDTKARGYQNCRRQFAPSAGIPVRCTADILPARCRRDKCGAVVEAYDTDAYGSTLIFTGPGADGVWFTDDDVQSNYGANGIIYCGYRYDVETELYYVRNRYYSPALGRWVIRDPIGYAGGINLYGYVSGWAPRLTDASGESFWTWVGVGVAIGLIAGVVAASQIVPGISVIVTATGTVAITGLVETATGLAAGAAIGAVAGAATGGLVESQLRRKTEKSASDCDDDNDPEECRACIAPTGTVGYRWDRVPPAQPHFPFPGDHLNLYLMQQSPAPMCKCFWHPEGAVEPPPLPGWIPITPAAGGGPA